MMTTSTKKFKQSKMGNKINSTRLQPIIITTTTKIKIWNLKIREQIKHLICRSLWAKLDQLWINAFKKVRIWISWSMEEKLQENVMLLRLSLISSFIMSFCISSAVQMDSLLALVKLLRFICLNRHLRRRLLFLTTSKNRMVKWCIL